MPSLILYGAFDRFNYGDMLMPIAIERFIRARRPEVLDRYDIRHASLTASDLSARDCLPSQGIVQTCRDAGENSVIVVAGGEVFAASRAMLYMHNSRDEADHRRKVSLRKNSPDEFQALIDKDLDGVWDYPYLPPVDALPPGGRIIYNAIGGSAGEDWKDPRDIRRQRMADAALITLRDARLQDDLSAINPGVHLTPCAVSLISGGYFTDFEQAPTGTDREYFVFQCNNSNLDLDEIAAALRKITQATGMIPYLVPLGYASNHDDQVALRALGDRLGDEAMIDATGSLSSIVSIFAKARFYVGTSLHGAITAMAYGIPYFPFKMVIAKLGAYSRQWSPDPLFAQVYRPGQLGVLPIAPCLARKDELKANAARLCTLAEANLNRICDSLMA